MLKKTLHFFLYVVAFLIIFFAVMLNLARVITPLLNQEKVFFEHWASQAIHQPVRVTSVRAYWRGLQPEINFKGVTILRKAAFQPIMKVDSLGVSINWWGSFVHMKLLPGRVFIDGVTLEIKQVAQNKFEIQGIPSSLHDSTSKMKKSRDMLGWLMTQSNIMINHVNINLNTLNNQSFHIRNIEMRISNSLLHHRMEGEIHFKQKTPSVFSFNVVLSKKNIIGRHYDADIYLNISSMMLSQWAQLEFLRPWLGGVSVQKGFVTAQSWIKWRDGKISTVSTKLAINQAMLSRLHQQPVPLKHLSGNFKWQSEADGWSVRADDLVMNLNNHEWSKNKFGFHYGGQNNKSIFFIDNIRLQDVKKLLPLVGKSVPTKFNEYYTKAAPTGELQDLKFAVWREDQHYVWQSSLRFQHIKANAIGETIGINNLSGQAFISPIHASIFLDSQNGSLMLPSIYNHPLAFNALKASILWDANPQGWQLKVSDSLYDDGNVTAHLKLYFDKIKKQSGNIKLLSNFSMLHVSNLKYYVPDKKIRLELKRWLSTSLKSGSIHNALMILQGPLKDFPFDQHQGRFEILASLKNVTMKFHPLWPSVKNITGNIAFDDRSMSIAAKNAQISGINLTELRANIPDLAHSLLMISGHADTDMSKGLHFIKQTPLTLKNELISLRASGPLAVNVNLKIPLFNVAAMRSWGELVFSHVILHMPKWHLKLTDINGVMNFNNADIAAKKIRSNFLGQPLVVAVKTEHAANDSFVHLAAQGAIDTQALEEKAPIIKSYAHGIAPFSADLNLRDSMSKKGSTLYLKTMLDGIVLKNLPSYFVKDKNDSSPLVINADLNKNNKLWLKVSYAKKLSTAMIFKHLSDNFTLYSAHVVLGDGLVKYVNEAGLFIDGMLPSFHWREWLHEHQQGYQHVIKLKKLSLLIENFYVKDVHLRHILVSLKQHDAGWLLNLNNKVISGYFIIPDDLKKRWLIHLDYLHIPKARKKPKKKESSSMFNELELPPLTVSIKSFMFHGNDFGTLDFKSRKRFGQLIIDRLVARNQIYAVTLSAFLSKKNKTSTSIQGTFVTNNFGKLLTQWQKPDMLTRGKGRIKFGLSWLGSPMDFNAKSLNGSIDIDLKNGGILAVNEKQGSELGLGRILNVLSLQSILKRLMLNFNDLFGKGLQYDTFNGRFDVSNGNATTDGLVIDGPVAKVYLHGMIGFAKKDYNFTLNVRPYLTSSAPLIAGLIGGPVAGMVVWIVNKAVSPGLGKLIGHTYKVEGAWGKPAIKKIPAPESREK